VDKILTENLSKENKQKICWRNYCWNNSGHQNM